MGCIAMCDFVPTPEQAEQVKKARDILLRSAGRRAFPELLWDMMKPGVAVHADRRIGKTEAIITAVHEREDGNAIIVAPTGEAAQDIIRRYRNAFLSYGAAGREPVITTAISLSLYGHSIPIYVDEWWMMSASTRIGLAYSGLVVGAVGTIRGLAGCIEAFSLIERPEIKDFY